MPPRTGPRRKRRVKAAPPLPARSFELLYSNDFIEMTSAHTVALNESNLVFSDHDGAITRIIARGHWRECHEVTAADLLPEVLREPAGDQPDRAVSDTPRPAEAVADPACPPSEGASVTRSPALPDGYPAVVSGTVIRAIPEDANYRFVPSSPEEAQRVLMELHRRIAPDYQDPPDEAPPAGSAAAPPKGAP